MGVILTNAEPFIGWAVLDPFRQKFLAWFENKEDAESFQDFKLGIDNISCLVTDCEITVYEREASKCENGHKSP